MLFLALTLAIGGAEAPGSAVVTKPLDEIVVQARRRPPPPPFSTTISLSSRDDEDIARVQADSLFAAVNDVPGLSVNGGPRASGMKFNIRGFSDTEDVIVELDGMVRGFEKYRFGSGVFIEPELLKDVEVERMPAITRGAGALGGSVRARTRDATDLLDANARLGVLTKLGLATNSEEQTYSGAVYGAPLPSVGLLAWGSRRHSNDLEVPNGARLANSASDSASGLLKGSWQPSAGLQLMLSTTAWQDNGLQPYDATGGQPGFFGTVEREIDDRTTVVGLRYRPGGPWLDLELSAGSVATRMQDLLRPGATPFSNAATGNVVDRFHYDTTSIRASNRSRTERGRVRVALETGVQFLDSRREISRRTESDSINDALYPGGFNPAQPPGQRVTLGLYALPSIEFGRLLLSAGARWDAYRVEAEGGAAAQLATFGEPARVEFDRLTPAGSLRLQLVRDAVALFYNRAEAFRPPLIDEYFTRGAFSRCIPVFLGDLAPASGVCGDLYVPEESTTQEIGLSLGGTRVLGDALSLKLTAFRTDVRQRLESISVLAPGLVGQPGTEERRGAELEAAYEGRRLFGRLGFSHVSGEFVEDGIATELYDVPGDTTTLLVGTRWLSGSVEFGYRLDDVRSRSAIVGGAPGSPAIGTQPGHRLHGAFFRFSPTDRLELRLVGDNLTNTSYRLNDGFGGAPGSAAPGRNVGITILNTF